MKIGIACYPTYGGSGVLASELGIALSNRGHEVHFISYGKPARHDLYSEGIFFHEVIVPTYPLFEYPPYSLALATKIEEVARYEKLDVIHAHYAVPHAASAFLAREIIGRDKLKIVTTLHGTDITLVGNDPSYLTMTRFSIEQSDAVTAVSEFLKKATLETIQVGTDIDVVYNFVDLDRFKPVKDRALECRWAQDCPVVMHASNFRPVKRIPDVLEVFKKVHNELKCKLLLVGDGPDRALAERFCRENSLCDDVIFLGKQAMVGELFNSADVFLFPSQAESFGLAALEAMACEVPVVGVAAGGLPEVITDGLEGYLPPPGDVDAMSDKVLKLLRDDELRREVGKAGRKKAIERFHPDQIIAEYEGIYRRVVEG